MNIHKNKGPECLPFDLRGRRILTYALAEDATPDERKAAAKSLTHDLTAALRDNIAGALDKKADQSTISRFPSDHNDFTIWMGPNKQLSIPNSFGRLETLAIEPGPRAYARIVPASWPDSPPDPLVVEKSQPAVQPKSGSYGSGSFGTCELGFARYWYSHVADDTHRSTNTIVLYLEEFGEYWFADATSIGEAKAGLVLSIPRLLRTWYSCSLQALQSLDALGASKRRYLEIGVNGIKNVYLAHRGEFYQTPQSRKASIRHDMQAASWTPETLAQLVHKAHNDVLSAFSLERIPLDAFMKKLEEL
jgi:hypothetical protein